MTREEMKRAIENNLKSNGISNAEIRVQRNPYGDGLQVVVITADFSNLPHEEPGIAYSEMAMLLMLNGLSC